jgi:hypothetical protein
MAISVTENGLDRKAKYVYFLLLYFILLLFESINEHITENSTIFWYVTLYSLAQTYVSDECAASMLFEEQAK